MPFCPSCREEYVSGIALCADCDVPLVSALDEPSSPSPPEAVAPEAVVVAEPDREDAAEAIAARLRALMIPARVASDDPAGPFRVEVPPELGERARMAASALVRRHDLDTSGADALATVAGRLYRFLGSTTAEIDPLGLLGGPDDELSERDRAIVYASRREIEQLGTEAHAALIRALFRGTRAVVRDAAKALVRLGPVGADAAVEALDEAIRHDLGPMRIAVAAALAEARVVGRAERVLALVKAAEPEVAIRAARALGELGDPAAGPWIIAHLRREWDSEELREELADALWTLTGQTVDLEPNGDPAELEAALTQIERRFGWTSSS